MLNPITHYHPPGHTARHPTINLLETSSRCLYSAGISRSSLYTYTQKEINADYSYQTGNARYLGGPVISTHALKE